MAAKKENTHDKYAVAGVQVEKTECVSKGDSVEVYIPKNMPYVKVRKALEIALLRIR